MLCCPVARQLLINVVTVKLEREQVLQKSVNVESMLMVRRGGEGNGEKGGDLLLSLYNVHRMSGLIQLLCSLIVMVRMPRHHKYS